MKRRKSQSLTSNLFAIAGLLHSLANLGAGMQGSLERGRRQIVADQIQLLKAKNLHLKNELTRERIFTQQNVTAIKSNDIVKGDQQIEKNELELKFIRKRAHVAGLLNDENGRSNQFVALDYPEPGDVRNGKLPKE